MKRIAIDFVAAPAGRSRWQAVLGVGLLLCGSALLAGWHGAQRQAALDAQLSEAVAVEPSAPVWSDEQRRALNEATVPLNFPWPAVMWRLERAAAQRVRLTAIDLRALEADIKLSAEAASPSEMLAFADALRRDPLWAGLKLTRQEASRVEGATGVQFTMEGRVPVAALRRVAP